MADKTLLSLPEYAAKVGRDQASVRRKCIAGRIPGAAKVGRNWIIPADAPYEDQRIRSGKYAGWRRKKRPPPVLPEHSD